MGILRVAARTAVISGTATAVSGRVAMRQADKYQEQQAEKAAAQGGATPPAAAPAEDDQMAKLKQLADLHAQGILTDEEFAAAKAKALGL